MIIVADSGSTKTDWMFLRDASSEAMEFSSMGFNPIYHSSKLIQEETEATFAEADFNKSQVKAAYYYGTAIWDSEKAKVVESALQAVFTQAKIEVHHDLLGAARATSGDEPGISCIIGTGSNTCSYDGQKITDNVTNLGYFLGDEGSGAHLGKALVKAYFYRELPNNLRQELEQVVPGGKSEFLSNIYGENTSPNVYLASLTKFIGEHKDHFFMRGLIYTSFAEFIDRHVRKYPKHLSLPIHFIGSVAYHFQDFLKIILEERGMQAGVFIKKPIDTLVDYHRSAIFQ
ncbi:MAG TPA: BadF/BadG/BcrA/BcrD ATPase family protein [Saprospiraceae bacterium]|nr:BadF/BadG/BcrA/BcrD ATPase family protein [Saprospiraceae bacterium]